MVIQPYPELQWFYTVANVAVFFTFLINWVFATGIYKDGQRFFYDGKATLFAKPLSWALATFIIGFPIIVIYWLLHHSSFSDPKLRR